VCSSTDAFVPKATSLGSLVSDICLET
jgi:hypothetical protein